MSIKIVREMVTGKEPMLDPILTYLAEQGIPARTVRSVVLMATVNEPLTLDVSLYVQGDERSTPRPHYVYPEGHGPEVCGMSPCPLHPDETAPKSDTPAPCPGCRESYWPDPKDRVHAHASGHPEMRNR